jgi:hypothetical protein
MKGHLRLSFTSKAGKTPYDLVSVKEMPLKQTNKTNKPQNKQTNFMNKWHHMPKLQISHNFEIFHYRIDKREWDCLYDLIFKSFLFGIIKAARLQIHVDFHEKVQN